MPMPSLPGNTPASLPSQPSSLSSPAAVSRHLAWVRCLSRPKHQRDAQWPSWLTACYHLTPYLQRYGVHSALLDLGSCTDVEAVSVVQALITRLSHQQITLRAAIAPSGTLAQFALYHLLHTPASAQTPLTLLTPEQTAGLLRSLPITALARLQFAEPTTITTRTLTQAASWLEEYGVRTLGHLARLARLNDDFLRRQFGARLGALLAAIARGEDLQPLQPTPAPLALRFRLRLASPVTPDRLLLGLPPFSIEVASKLARRGLHGHTLELRLRWEGGPAAKAEGNAERITTITRTLSRPLSGGRTLAETLERMLASHVQVRAHTHAHESIPEVIEDLHLTISHLTPRYPAQHAFWPQRARRLAATQELADVLARRHGKPLLLQSVLTAPDAIFDQNRSHLAPLHTDVAADLADVAESSGHPARPASDVADVDTDSDTGADVTQFPHGIHWW
jgi:hypothetical protein